MENLNGIKLQLHDMKKDGDEILYFKQLEKSGADNKDSPSQGATLTEGLFQKYEYLLVNSDNELLGIKGENSELIFKTKDAYKLAQGLFISG